MWNKVCLHLKIKQSESPALSASGCGLSITSRLWWHLTIIVLCWSDLSTASADCGSQDVLVLRFCVVLFCCSLFSHSAYTVFLLDWSCCAHGQVWLWLDPQGCSYRRCISEETLVVKLWAVCSVTHFCVQPRLCGFVTVKPSGGYQG